MAVFGWVCRPWVTTQTAQHVGTLCLTDSEGGWPGGVMLTISGGTPMLLLLLLRRLLAGLI